MRGAYFYEQAFPKSLPKANASHFTLACEIVANATSMSVEDCTAIICHIRMTYNTLSKLLKLGVTAEPLPALEELKRSWKQPMSLNVREATRSIAALDAALQPPPPADAPADQGTLDDVRAEPHVPLQLPLGAGVDPLTWTLGRLVAARYIITYGITRYPEMTPYVAEGGLMFWRAHKHLFPILPQAARRQQ